MFLSGPDQTSPDVRRLYDEDIAEDGYVMNLTRMWAHVPAVYDAFATFAAGAAAETGGLSIRDKGVLVAALAATLGDSYCATAWRTRLADASSPELSAGVLRGDDSALEPREQALARWARLVAGNPSSTTADDVDALRAVGFTDPQIAALTCYIAARVAFSSVNDALGAQPDRQLAEPDRQLAEQAPDAVRAVITFGRPSGT